MENGAGSRLLPAKRPLDSASTVVFNDEYAAWISTGEIYILRLEHLDRNPQYLSCPKASGWARSVLALSVVCPNLVAASLGSVTYIFDTKSLNLKHILPGAGRTVTSITFSTEESKLVITGHVDGSICLWDLDAPAAPLRRLVDGRGVCSFLSLSRADANFLASLHDDKLVVRYLDTSISRPLCSLRDKRCNAFSWHPSTLGRLAVSTTDRELRIYQLPDTLKAACSPEQLESSDEDSEIGVFGKVDNVQEHFHLISTLALDVPLQSVSWVGDTTILGLGQKIEDAFLYEAASEIHGLIEVWSCEFEHAPAAVCLRKEDGAMSVLGIGHNNIECQEIPDNVANNIQFEDKRTKDSAETTVLASGHPDLEASESVPKTNPQSDSTSPTIAPMSISKKRAQASAFEKTSLQIQQKRRFSKRRHETKALTPSNNSDTQSRELFTPSSTNDEEHPTTADEDDHIGSPMPFLSPAIPSRKISPNEISPLDETVMKPPQPSQSPFGSFVPSTAPIVFNGQDSDDSDDETFVDDMQGSAAFLPGGINVPLPKACGALFAPNGELLTFFPPKVRPVSARKNIARDQPRVVRREGDQRPTLFPTFGNLEGDLDSLTDSYSDDSIVVDGEESNHGELPRFTFQPASFPSQLSWRSRDLTFDRDVDVQPAQRKIIVKVHDVRDVSALYPTQRDIASGYRLLCNAGESGADLCEYNATISENATLVEVGEVWRLLAMLLRDQVPLELLSSDDSILVIAQRARTLTEDGSITDLIHPVNHPHLSGKLRWSDHPFGGAWLVRRVLEWAERRADVQSLACMSGILSEAQGLVCHKDMTAQHATLTHLPSYSLTYLIDATTSILGQTTKPRVPLLRCHSATITSLQESPTKVLRLSSQPSTPYLDSGSTPPLSLPSISRQSTRLSTSGSVSPELQRGSFSTAAKAYAQSITDKFSSHGTSPPLKRTDTIQTTTTELSNSLPSGSWPGKSVSFASNTAERELGRSLSVSAYRANHDDDVYDSDRTIEDSSVPHTPKPLGGDIAVTVYNQAMFADEISGSAKVKLIPQDLFESVAIWNQYYGELLRSWDMLIQATELEKLGGLTIGALPQSGISDLSETGLIPTAVPQQRKTACDICLTTTEGIMQVCPSCLHSSHLGCLEEYCADLEDEEFTCPSGCGCYCSSLPYAVQNPPQSSPQRPSFKKKPSFTDPRRWRARVEGDSW